MGDTFEIFVMRHGRRHKDRYSLTKHGQSQVRASVEEHLRGAGFDLYFNSGRARARQTAGIVIEMLGERPTGDTGETHKGFDFRVIEEWRFPDFPWEDAWEVLKANGNPNVFHLLKVWSPAWFLAAQVTCALQGVAKRLQAEGGSRAFVVSHTPVAESAVPNTRFIPLLSEGDMVRYTLKIVDGEARIVKAKHLPCPIH